MSARWTDSKFVRPYASQLSPEAVDLLNRVLHVDPVRGVWGRVHVFVCADVCMVGGQRGKDIRQGEVPSRACASPPPPPSPQQEERYDLDAIASHPWMRK